MGVSSCCLIEDNIVADTFPDMEIDSSSGNVFAYNFCDDKAVQGDLLGCSINSNHGGHGSYNLYEGNVAPRFQCDGYHGSAAHDTAFRNWFHGTSTLTNQYWICVNLNRFTRCYNVVGNVLGRPGLAWLYEVETSASATISTTSTRWAFPTWATAGRTGRRPSPARAGIGRTGKRCWRARGEGPRAGRLPGVGPGR